jgi:hypothetical protein
MQENQVHLWRTGDALPEPARLWACGKLGGILINPRSSIYA